MRGGDERTGERISYVDLEKRVRSDHPLRPIRAIPPEKLLRAMLCEVFYSIRSERQLMEGLEYDLLFRVVCRSRRG
jgi:transposase